MPIDYTALATEINTDPAGLGYAPFKASGADDNIAALLNARTATGSKSLLVSDLEQYLIDNDLRRDIQTATGSGTAAIARAANLVMDVLTSPKLLVYQQTPTSKLPAALTTLKNNSVITNGQLTAINALTTTLTTSRAETLFGMAVTAFDVAKALGRGN